MARILRAASSAALPAMNVTRDEYEPRSIGVVSVSAVTNLMSAGCRPSSSAMIVEHRVRALADVHRAAIRGDASAVDFDLDLGVGHIVPVDRGAGAGQIAGDRETHTASHPRLAVMESRCLDDALGALVETAGRDAQPVDGARVGLDEVALLQLDRIETDVVRDLLQVQLECEPRLGSSVAAFGTAGRLVGEDATSLEPVCGDVVGDRLQRPRVEGGGDSVRPVCAAVERAAEVHGW